MNRSPALELTLHHDVLCGWSWLADKRLRLLCEEFHPALKIRYSPFPVRLEDRLPTEWERMAEASAWRKVRREKDGKGIVTDLWRSDDPPRSSLPPLVALEAARIVGGEKARDRLLASMRQAAFRHGINVTRDDVILELAEKEGLEVSRFANAFFNEQTQRHVIDRHDEAAHRGIDSVPTVILEGDWMITGVRSIDEYRNTIRRYIQQQGLALPERIVH